MSAIIVCEIKKTPKVKDFLTECSQIMQVKGFTLVSRPDAPLFFFYNPKQTIAMAEINSLIKMIKAISSYTQVVNSLQFSQTLRRG
jgi:hypothetical protein